MTDPREAAPSAGEELEREIREAETAVPERSRDDHDSEAGDTLTPNLGAQREAKDPDDGDRHARDREARDRHAREHDARDRDEE